MESNQKVKELLDELAGVLAEMGAIGDGVEEPVAAPVDDRAADKAKPAVGEESAEETAAEGVVEEDTDAVEAVKEKKMRCLCERAEKIRDRVQFYEAIASKELELRTVLDKSTPASETRSMKHTKEGRSVSIYHNLAGAGRLRGFKGANSEERAYRAGQFFRATLMKNAEAARWCADNGVVTESRAQGESVNSLGGVFVNDEILNEIIVLTEEFGAYAAAARNVNMQSDTLIIPRRVGGLQAYFVGENASVTDSDASWDRIQLIARKVAVSNRMSSEIMEDSSVLNLADYIATEVARAIAQLTDRVGFVGTGSGLDGGIIGACTKINDGNHTASVVTAGSGAVSAETITIADLISTAGRLPLYSRSGARWFCSPAVYAATVQRLGLSNNVGLSGGNTQDSLTNAPELRLLGYPVNFVHVMNSTLGSDPGAVKFLLGDLQLSSMYGTRRSLQLRTSVDRYAELDQTLLVASMRMDCVTHDCGSNTVAGPVVALKTAAS